MREVRAPAAVPIYSEHGLIADLPEPPMDEETAALKNKARNFVSSIDWIAKRKDPPPAKRDFPIRANWTKRFAVQWNDDGGFTLGGKYVPQPPSDPIPDFSLTFFLTGPRH